MATKKIQPTYQFDGGMILPTGAGADKVLGSDVSGNASWVAATTAFPIDGGNATSTYAGNIDAGGAL